MTKVDCLDDDWHAKDRRYRECKDDDRQRRRRRELERLNDDKNRTYTPWLLIRYAANDIGLRPIPAGSAYWNSPDIWVESSDPGGKAVAGEQNFVHARVFNLGKSISVPTRVDFYWADPSIGLGPQHMNLIGTEWVSVDPHTALDVRCNKAWVPVFVNNGHECLKVNCTNMALDPIQHPFQPKVDRHAGQRNIAVVQGAAGASLKFMALVNNLLRFPVRMEIVAQVEHLRVDRKLAERLAGHELYARVAAFDQKPRLTTHEMANRFTPQAQDYGRAVRIARYLGAGHDEALRFDAGIVRVGRFSRSAARLDASWGKERRRVVPAKDVNDALASFQSHAELAEAPSHAHTLKGFTLAATEFDGYEQRMLELRIDPPGTFVPGEFLVLTLEQWIAGVLIGGYTVLVKGG